MFEVVKRLEISAAHYLKLDYPSKCSELHGHNWEVTVYLRSNELNANGMIMDFSEIKRLVVEPLDHKVINDVVPFNPTAENLAKYISDLLQPYCYRVEVRESENNMALYEVI